MKYIVVNQEPGLERALYVVYVSGDGRARYFDNGEELHSWLGQQSAVKVFGERGLAGTYRLPSK